MLERIYRAAKPAVKRKAPHTALMLLLFAVSAASGAFLPDLVPTHWDSRGMIDGYGSKYELIFLLPAGALLVFAVGNFAESRFRLPNRKMREFLSFLQFFFLVIFAIVQIKALLGAQNIFFAVERLLAVPAALLFDFAGRAARDAEHGSLFGIQTKWTLGNPGVWGKTNRLAAYLFRISAAAMLASAFFPGAFRYLAVGAACMSIIIPSVYSMAISQSGGAGGSGGGGASGSGGENSDNAKNIGARSDGSPSGGASGNA
ncbi:MAG: DUF1648 domain-containing protein, partial [Clostridiales bacterium]|nr:DUF1648 domain-containing protein [Clostridiales bacterium]